MLQPWSIIDGNNINQAGFKLAEKILNRKRIVIADDSNSILKWLKFSLEDYGANVYVFEHGKDTIDFLKQNAPVDVLILDLIMNEIGGLEIAKFATENVPNTKVFFITGCECDSSEFVAASKIGSVLQKPVGLEEMLSSIMTILEPDWESQYALSLERAL